MCATFVDVIFVVDMAIVNVLYLSVLVDTNSFLFLILSSGPSISMETNSSGPAHRDSSSYP